MVSLSLILAAKAGTGTLSFALNVLLIMCSTATESAFLLTLTAELTTQMETVLDATEDIKSKTMNVWLFLLLNCLLVSSAAEYGTGITKYVSTARTGGSSTLTVSARKSIPSAKLTTPLTASADLVTKASLFRTVNVCVTNSLDSLLASPLTWAARPGTAKFVLNVHSDGYSTHKGNVSQLMIPVRQTMTKATA